MEQNEIILAVGLTAVFGYAIYSARGIPAFGFALPFAVTGSCSGVADQPWQCSAVR